MGGANAQDHRAGKGPGGCEGWGLGSRNRRGPGVPPTLVSEGRRPHLGTHQASWAQVVRAVTLCSSPASPRGPLPPASPDFPGLSPMPSGSWWPGWGFGGGLLAWELSRLPGPSGPGDDPLLLSRSSRRVPPTCLS